jgi:hypothetical protein
MRASVTNPGRNEAVLFAGLNYKRGAHDAEDAEQPAAADVQQAACR